MKQNAFIKALALALALCLCLAACGGSHSYEAASSSAHYAAPAAASGNYMAMDEEMDYAAREDAVEMPAEATALSEGGQGSGTVPDTARKIVYTGSMELQTKEFDAALEAITRLVAEAGGYIASQETTGRSLTYYGNYYERRASMTVRVPVAKFDSLMTGVAGVCNVTDRSVWTEDISERYYDTEVHLSTLRLQEERLLDILSKAEKLEDVITLEQELSNVRYEIESLTAQLRRMKDRVDYSTLTLNLQEVVEYSEIETPPATFGEKVAEAAKRSARSIRDFFEGLILWIIEELPVTLLWLVLLGFILWVVIRVLRFIFRKNGVEPKVRKPFFKRKKKEENPNPPADDSQPKA